MGFYSPLLETLKRRPFDEEPGKQRFLLNSRQCESLASRFSSVSDKFLGIDAPSQASSRFPPSAASKLWKTASSLTRDGKQCESVGVHSNGLVNKSVEIDSPTQALSRSLPSGTSRPWKTISNLRSNRFFSTWSSVGRVKRSRSALYNFLSDSEVLKELESAPQSLEELYRVIKGAEVFLNTCRNRNWWRAAVSLSATAEARDVHMHDLEWCIAGLELALHDIRGVSLESRAEFCRLGIANCYAQLETSAAVNSDSVRNQEQDHEDLLSKLKKVKKVNDGMNFVSRKMTDVKEKLKHGIADFLLQKLTQLESTSLAAREPPKSMRIRKEDLKFPCPPCLIGSGSYGTVFQIFWLGIKVAAKQFPYDPYKELFDAEVAILAELRSPFVVQFIGWCVDEQNNACYLISELAETNLTNFVRNRREPLQLHVVIDSMLQVSRGMEYLHSKRIMHRDLKPSNILVQPFSSCKELKEKGYGRLKLCDFGIARFQPDRSDLMTAKVGTLCYMAPEVWPLSNGFETDSEAQAPDRVKYSFEADVYSFAMTFTFTLIGQEPFAGVKSGNALMNMLRYGERPELPFTCPKLLKELLQKCWSQNPSSRPSFSSISMALRHLKLLLMGQRSPEGRLDSLLSNELSLSTPVVSYHDISAATYGLTARAQNINVGNVYNGILPDLTTVLVHLKLGFVDHGNYWSGVSKMLSLRHGNIVQLHAVCIHHDQCWFLYKRTGMQRSLNTWMENPDQLLKPLDEEGCFRVALGVAYGLQYLHSQNISFAVTSKNILLTENFEPQILISFLIHEEQDDHQRRSDVLHFREVISGLLLHLSSNLSQSKNTLQNSLTSLLEAVEHFCVKRRDATMDEVLVVLETHLRVTPENLDSNLSGKLVGLQRG